MTSVLVVYVCVGRMGAFSRHVLDFIDATGGTRAYARFGRRVGRRIAPKTTRRIEKAIRRAAGAKAKIRDIGLGIKSNLDEIGEVGTKVLNTPGTIAGYLVSGDIAGGLHAGVHGAQDAGALFKSASRLRGRIREAKDMTKLQDRAVPPRKQNEGGSSLQQFDSNVANDPRISGDLLARMTKSVRQT